MKAILMMLAVLSGAALAADDLANLADPTRPAGGRATARGQGMVLQSTIVSPERKVAVINGQVLGVGGRIGNATVVDVRPYEVIVERAGRKSVLRIAPPLNKMNNHDETNEH